MRVFLIAIVAGALASASQAQPVGGLGGGLRSNEPMDVSSEGAERVDANCLVILRGNVELIQAGARIRSPLVNVYYERGAAGAQQRCGSAVGSIDANGPFYYVTAEQSARADHALYTASTETIVLTGNVVITQGQSVITGSRATINTRTNDARIEAGQDSQVRGRVRAVLYPAQPQAAGAARPAARAGR